MNIPNRRETFMLAAVFAIANLGNGILAATQRRPSGGFQVLYYIALTWAIALWIAADAKAFRQVEPFDFGWFVFLAWPLVFPYHLLRTRGAKGLITLAGLLGVYVASYLLALVVYFAIVALR